MISDIAEQVLEKLAELGQTLAVAESCTGGQLSAAITAIPGASKVFLGGVVSYTDEVKEALLDVSEETLRLFGAVSEQTAREMATGVRARLGADYGVGITGIAGPGGGTPNLPVGLVYIGWAGPQLTDAGSAAIPGRKFSGNGSSPQPWSNVARFRFRGDREAVQQAAVEMALAGLMQRLGLIEL